MREWYSTVVEDYEGTIRGLCWDYEGTSVLVDTRTSTKTQYKQTVAIALHAHH